MGESRPESSTKIGGFELVKEAIIEAKDNYGTWYPAKVLAVVDDKVSFSVFEVVLVETEGWPVALYFAVRVQVF